MANDQLSGRDLDRAIAERVMGWRRKADGWQHGKQQEVFVDEDGYHTVSCLCEEDFNPSESVEAAMQVVEKMRRDHFRFACNDRHIVEIGEWWVEFATLEYERGGQANSGTLPEAICRAALAAIENQ